MNVIEDGEHPFAPGAVAQPLGERQQAVLDVLGRAEQDPPEIRLRVAETFLRKRVGVGQRPQPRRALRLRAENVEHPAVEERPVRDRRRQHHERVVVRRAVAGVPDALVAAEIARDQPRVRIGVLQPAVHIPPAAAESFIGRRAVGRGPDVHVIRQLVHGRTAGRQKKKRHPFHDLPLPSS